jgi:hypothetical protein
MAVERQTILAIVLGVVGAGALYTVLQPKTSPVQSAAGAPRAVTKAAHGQAHGSGAPEVRLESLAHERPSPTAIERNLFRFKPKPVARPPAPVAAYEPPPPPPGPPPPPPVPPIGLRFIGVLQSTPSTRIAILSDGRGAPIYGKEGEAILGQYRILQINADSIEMAYLDGRGRQRIRLSGS